VLGNQLEHRCFIEVTILLVLGVLNARKWERRISGELEEGKGSREYVWERGVRERSGKEECSQWVDNKHVGYRDTWVMQDLQKMKGNIDLISSKSF